MTFSGWPAETVTWFKGLEADNSKPYFTAHRRVYDEAVRGPLEALLAEIEAEFGEGKIFRPYRDVRFSADKSPYKTEAAAAVGPKQGGVYYVGVSADGIVAGAGYHGMQRDQLDRYRQAAAGPSGSALEKVVEAGERAGLELYGDALKTAPRGYPVDHPRIRLLRLKDVILMRREAPGAVMHTPEALDWVTAAWRTSGPLVDWLNRHVGASGMAARR